MKLSKEQLELAKKLTTMQRRIVLSIVCKGTKHRDAYYEAGGKNKNINSVDAYVSQTLSKDHVREFMNSVIESTVAESVMERDEALKILSDVARAKITDVGRFFSYQARNDEGESEDVSAFHVKDSDEMTKAAVRAISEVTTGRDTMKIKLHSQLAAIKQLAVMRGWEAAQKHEVEDTTPREPMDDKELARKLAFILTKASKGLDELPS